ncbi:hypothetical protein NBN67_19820 [Clostridioides difficile]|nr:hypothetical protein [Clostridioides difficile]MCM0739786.1 hypothetical protein [Clostridioides difficile]
MHKTDLEWIKRHPWYLRFAKKQSYGMCLEAVRRYGLALKDIRWDELNLK